MTRYRTRSVVTEQHGYADPMPGYEHILGHVDAPSLPSGWDRCYDETDSRGEVNPFFIESKRFVGGSYSGQDGTYYRASNWNVSADAGFFSSIPDPPDYNTVMSHALAKTAPYVADWSAFNALYELKDFKDLKDMKYIPHRIHNIGYEVNHGIVSPSKPGWVKDGAGHYLYWQFGIQPLISDLRSSLDFIKRTDSRINDFNGFSRPGGASKNATIYNQTSHRDYAGTSYCTGLYGAGAQYATYLTTSRKIWGSVNWSIPKGNLPPRGSQSEWLLASQLANGLQISPDTLWQAMPWTWLFDWFSNMSDFIKLSYNTIGASSGRYCVMDHTKVQCHTESGSPGFHPSDGAYYETKRRTPWPFVYPEARLPFINNDMAGILGALAVQRAPVKI